MRLFDLISMEKLSDKWNIDYFEFKQRFKVQGYAMAPNNYSLKIPPWPPDIRGTFYKQSDIAKIEKENPSILENPNSIKARNCLQKLFIYISAKKLMSRWGLHRTDLIQLEGKITAHLLPEAGLEVLGSFSPFYPTTEEDFQEAYYLFSDIEKFEKDYPDVLESTLPARVPPPLDSDEELNNFLMEIIPDIDQFYAAFKNQMSKSGGMLHTSPEDAVDTFEKIKPHLKYINLDDLNGDFYGTDKPARDIKGGIAQNMLRRLKPSLCLLCKITNDRQKIYSKIMGFKKPVKSL